MSEEMNDVVEATETATTEAVKTDPLLEQFQQWVDDGIAEDDIIVKLHEEHDLSFPAAVGKYRKLKSEAGLTSPRGHKAEDVQSFIKEGLDQDMSRAEIIGAMVQKFGYTKKSAASTFSVQGKKMGIVGEGTGATQKVPLEEIVAFMRANAGDKRQELVAKMVEEFGYAESTCGAFYTYIPMAQEWAKQEVAALSHLSIQ